MDLSTLSVKDVESFLESYEFFTPAHTETLGKGTKYERTYDYEDSREAGWFAVEQYADGDGWETPIGKLTLVETEGGEGQGDQYHMVLRLTQGKISRTFKMQGWYASHHGHEFDGPFTEVSKKKKTITVWE